MKSELMFSLIYPLHLCTITLFIIFITLDFSYGDKYEDCSSRVSCGRVKNIGYPFWGAGRPSYCGHPALQIHCSSNHTGDFPTVILSFGELGNPLNGDWEIVYSILNIQEKPDEDTITIKIKELISHDTCSISYIEKGVDEISLFEYRSPVHNISLVSGIDCHDPKLVVGPNSITCQASGKNVTSYYVQDTSYWLKKENCEVLNISMPIGEELDDLVRADGTLVNVLQQEFEVDYSHEFSAFCFKCQLSGGVCGSSASLGFICHCKDNDPGVFHQLCPIAARKLKRLKLILGLGSSGGGILMLIVLVPFLRKRRSTNKFSLYWKGKAGQCQNVDAFLRIYGSLAPKRYTYASIRKMTNSFKEKLGEGGYASVYKGRLCGSGCLVAVKLFKETKGNGEDFINEVASISRTNHVNIVALLGFCIDEKKRALIYEFMPNGSLEKFTYQGASNMSLPWEKSFEIAVGIARGLDYLHRGCNARILHLDIKPHNVLLDENFIPKISDFGLARLCPSQESSISMLEARGTIGYIAPEVFCRNFGGVASHKSDVYSYGMMVLDLVCGRKNTCAEANRSSELYFPEWIYNKIELKEEIELQGKVNDEERDLQRKMILVSLWCIQPYPSNRPSMSRVLEMLDGCLESIPTPSKPCLVSPPRLASNFSGTLSTQ